jgi:biopolymer transport protein ExbB/biopolymer transport protein TolQ
MAAVSGGIAEALVATGLGIFVAIPAVVAFNHFTGKLENFHVELNRASSQVVNRLFKVPEITVRGAAAPATIKGEAAYAR